MRRQGWAAFCAVTLVLSGCSERKVVDTWSNASGSVALSRDDSLLYVVDADNGLLAVVDTERREKVSEVRVGSRPERVTVGPDDTVYVTNRGGRSVSVIRRGDAVEAARIPVGVEPTGLTVSPDGRTLYVVNSATLASSEHGSLTAIDTDSLTARWELPLGEEPRGIALLEDGRKAAVTLFRQGDVMTVDLTDADRPRVLREGTDLNARANRAASRPDRVSALESPPLPGPKQGPRTFRARAMADLLGAPDGRRLFAPVLWSREDPLAASPDDGMSGGGSMYGGGTPCGADVGGGVVAAGLITFDADGEAPEPVVDDLDECRPPPEEKPDYPTSLIASPSMLTPLQGPTAAVVDPSGSWLFLVNQETNNVAIVPAWRRSGGDMPNPSSSVRQVVAVGAGPNGIALTRDGRKAYVYNAFDHTLSTLVSGGEGPEGGVFEERQRLALAGDVLAPLAAAGRRLFFSAADARMTSPRVAVSCASCHFEGREDGHVWGFPDGPRQTPSLAGRMTTSTAPFHWSGEFSGLGEFMNATVKDRMGGTELDADTVAKLAAFIDTIPATDNPHRGEPLNEAQARGAALYKKAACDTCHGGAVLTNNTNADVGTFVRTGVLQDAAQVIKAGLNTPSLLGVGRTAPYLHDGSAPTLRARLLNGRETNQHGQTSQLSDADVDDLVAYLQTL
ncbi:c-type cytochrome [Corallococcus sp. BB11-1]|uniref:c-type cytochrome n=1 Tax=Corallococcus sp. BB11-1 TaxID=2996783 RepID=UPI00226F642C|nr:c-type cytochrome [Corallococcus sp. BB11-1]MCY1035549.1 c-type cytochrome [Corallococcus sp. BB11-1]